MSTFRMVSAFCAVTVMSLALSASRIYADTPQNRSEVTFYQPMQVPGGVLAPGSYVFTSADSASGGYIVNVFNANETELVASLSAVANPRLEQPQDDRFVYWETLQGWPQAVRAWFCPGDNIARELQYSAEEATVLSAVINQNVPIPAAEQGVDPEGMPLPIQNAELDAVEPDTAAQLSGGSQRESIMPSDVPSPIAELAQETDPESNGEHMWADAVLSSEVTGEVTGQEEDIIPPDMPPAIYEQAQAAEAAETDSQPEIASTVEMAGLEPVIPAGVRANIAQLAQASPPNRVMEGEPTRALELPKTASYLPLCGLLGLLSLGAASAIRLLRN